MSDSNPVNPEALPQEATRAVQPLRFQAEMGFLLAILMMVNMFVGVLLLPSLIHIFKPKFISRDIKQPVEA